MRDTWNCIYQFDEISFFARISRVKVSVSDGIHCVRDYFKESVTGCTYNGNMLWLSLERCNNIISVDATNKEKVIPVVGYDSVRIVKMVTRQEAILVLECIKGTDKTLLLFDCITNTIISLLPISNDFIDLIITGTDSAVLLCEELTKIPARYEDDDDDSKVLFFAELENNKESLKQDIKKSISLYISYDDFDERTINRLHYDDGLRFPLFDNFLFHWLKQKSFSSSGSYVVYYCEDIDGIIIGSPIGGDIYRVITLPKEAANKENLFYFNEQLNELTVVSINNIIIKYRINCISLQAIYDLNQVYNEAYAKKVDLSVQRDRGISSFTTVLYKAIGSCICSPIQTDTYQVRSSNDYRRVDLCFGQDGINCNKVDYLESSVNTSYVYSNGDEKMGCTKREPALERTTPQQITNQFFGPVVQGNAINSQVSSSGNNSIVSNPVDISTVIDEIRKSIENEGISKEDKECALDLLKDISSKIEQGKKPGIIKSALVGLKDFVLDVGANVTAALIAGIIQGY